MGGEIKPLLEHISDDLHEVVKSFRNTETIVSTPLFKKLFELSPDKDDLHSMIIKGRDRKLRVWIESNKKLLPVDDWTVEMLRAEAMRLKIPNYIDYNKGMLINAVKRRGT
jgi:hypothetical protein